MSRGKFIIPQWMLATFALVITASVVSFLMAGPVDAKSYSNIAADQQANAEPDGTWAKTRGQIDYQRRIFNGVGGGACPDNGATPEPRLVALNGNSLSFAGLEEVVPFQLLIVTDSLLSPGAVGSPAGLVFDDPAGVTTNQFWDLSVDSIFTDLGAPGLCNVFIVLTGTNQADGTPVGVGLFASVYGGLPLTTGVNAANNFLNGFALFGNDGFSFFGCGFAQDGVFELGGDITTVPVPPPGTCGFES